MRLFAKPVKINQSEQYSYTLFSTESNVATESKVILPYEIRGEYYVEPLGDIPRKTVYSFLKRLFDILFSALLLVLLLLPMLLLAVAVKCSSPGSVLFFQDRLGKNGKPFRIIKFRTMYHDAEKDGAQWSCGDDDPRITRIGSFLRKTRLDELPQLWCIFTGTMSFVGPRPEREIFYNEFELYIHGFRQRLKVKPGLTGLAQVNGGYDLRPEEKILYDIEYIKKRSIRLDIQILLRTIAVVFTHDGAK